MLVPDMITPDIIINKLSAETLEEVINKERLNSLFLDLDGVLVEYRSKNLIPDAVNSLRQIKIPKYIISNRIVSEEDYANNKELLSYLEETINAQTLLGKRKPFFKVNYEGRGAMIGDTIFIDVAFARYNGLYSILLMREQRYPRWMRILSRIQNIIIKDMQPKIYKV